MTDAPIPRARSYTDTESARSLHATFVANVFKRLAELGQLHPSLTPSGHAIPGVSGRPNYEWLSGQSGIPRRTLENLLNLHNQPTMVGAAKIAQAIGVPLDTLLGQESFGRVDAATGALECIHSDKWKPGFAVCPSCLAKWQSYQQRLRDLYETNRFNHTEKWNAENVNVRAAQVRAAGLPEGSDER